MLDFTLAHFTDPHVTNGESRLKNGIDANQRLTAAIERLLRLRTKTHAAIFTGDLVDRGDPAEYKALERLIQPLRERMPVYLLIGNHDHREHFLSNTRNIHSETGLQQTGWVQFSVPLCPGHRLIALDSVDQGHDAGSLCPARLAWLAQTLDQHESENILLAVHHPPFKSGNQRFDGIGLMNAEALEAVLTTRTNVQLIISGHLHRAVSGSAANIPIVCAPSTAHPYAFDHSHDFKGDPNDELPGFALHRLIDGRYWASHHIWFRPISTT